MLSLIGNNVSTAITTLKTPYYVGVASGIDISSLGLSLNGVAKSTITSAEANKTLTK